MNAGSTAAVICVAFKAFERNTLRGFADLWLRAGHMTLHGCAVHQKGDRRWIGLPAKPQLDHDRNLVLNGDGKIQYYPVLMFDDREVGDRFSIAGLKAIDEFTAAENGGAGGDPDDEIGF